MLKQKNINDSDLNKYKCAKCGKIVERESTKKWIRSICDKTGFQTRIYLQK